MNVNDKQFYDKEIKPYLKYLCSHIRNFNNYDNVELQDAIFDGLADLSWTERNIESIITLCKTGK